MMMFNNFTLAIQDAKNSFRDVSYPVKGQRWQSIDISDKPEMATREILNYSLSVALRHSSLKALQEDVGPNLPWADDHFEERVGGSPLNPGVQWAKWPWALSADNFRKEAGGRFSHTYMERYWPKQANKDPGIIDQDDHWGIRYRYGDLGDIVEHLTVDPMSRQAYLPVWFPEDTGVVHNERVPCSLGYHFIIRNGYLHMVYYLRSCEFVRHFRDDIYLSVRLQLWMMEKLKERGASTLKPGIFTMHITSFHIFLNDYRELFKNEKTFRDEVR